MKCRFKGFGVHLSLCGFLVLRSASHLILSVERRAFWVFLGYWYVKVNDSGNLECGSMCKFSSLGVWIILPLSSKHVMMVSV